MKKQAIRRKHTVIGAPLRVLPLLWGNAEMPLEGGGARRTLGDKRSARRVPRGVNRL
ncbi:hypothetical protein AWB78_08399 [Caballeronia calidae]|uniref:Uncharacterized protein n=1 Tax=Caballeronia calidae TaxID=1777139 RepID=A0A158EMC1_9BURK|nr:hypothetical protein [Caballeronia calidae]SAL07067.1 hypothetical protein AWB78_08399 [Caballeronia calidae]